MSSPPSPSSAPPGPARVALAVGWRRVRAAGWSVPAAYLLNLLLALPLAAVVQMSLKDSLRHREAAERLLAGWDGLWHRSFSAQASGIEDTFDAGVVGIGAVLRSLDTLARGASFDLPAPILIVGLLYLAGWVFLSGGLLARFSGDERGLVTLGALHFRRVLKVAMVGWLGFWLVMAGAFSVLSALIEQGCRDVIDERVHAAWLMGKYAVIWGVMVAVRVVIDYAKVAAVSDPSRGTRAALREGLAMVGRRTRSVVGLQLMLGAIGLGLLLAYWAVAPGADQANPFKILVAFLISQSSVLARVVMRAWTLASEQALLERAGPGADRR